MDKYYTPSIEEFHVGFEYEELYGTWTDQPYWKKVSWTQDDFENDHHCYLLTDAYHNGNLRVKHLDREDIESCLGEEFEEKKHRLEGELSYIRGSIWSQAITVSLYEGRLKIVEYDFKGENNPNSYETIFKGTIKNKSELKRLLKQLGI